jgi:hypothetical protein
MPSPHLPVTLIATAAVALLAACAAVSGPTAQLERMTQAQTQGNDAANAAEQPDGDCAAKPQDAACLRIQAIRGRACLALARAEAAPGAACPPPTATVRRHLDCAVEAYAKAQGAAPAGSADALNLAENTARAQYCNSGFKPPAEGLALLREARSGLATLPAAPERDLLGASAALALAQRSGVTPEERCAAARDAARLAARALGASPPADIADAATATRNAARQAVGSLPNCPGV